MVFKLSLSEVTIEKISFSFLMMSELSLSEVTVDKSSFSFLMLFKLTCKITKKYK